jgi:hypothetical protein
MSSGDRESPGPASREADELRTRPPVTSRVPALAERVAQLVAQGLKAPAIAGRLGLTDSYVAKLRRIMRDVPPDVLRDWQNSRQPLPVDAMLKVAASDDASARYRELATSSRYRRGTGTTLERARKYGRMFARLDAFGFRAPMPPYHQCVEHIFPRLDPTHWDEAATELERGWEERRLAEEAEE